MKNLLMQLHHGKIIIYPTESVFGLGCDPDNEEAVCTLLKMKNRSWKKGLVLVAANYGQLYKYIDDNCLNTRQRSYMFASWPGPTTWLVPARVNTPNWLTGKFSFFSVAVRISSFGLIRRICLAFKKPLISTSANLSGYPPARSILEVYNQLGNNKNSFFIYKKSIPGGALNPSSIRNVITGELIRA